MKKRSTKLLRLFMVLALVTGIIGSLVPVSSASAGHGGTEAVAVTVSSTRAAGGATYTIVGSNFTTVPALGTVTVTFPAGTTVPSAIGRTTVSINGVAPSADPVVVSRAVTITNSATAATGTTVTVIFSAAAGIKNPGTPGNKTVALTTSADATSVTSATYAIARYVTFSPSTGAIQGGTVTVSGGGWSAGTTARATGSVRGTATVAAGGTFSITGSRAGTGTTTTVTDGVGNTATTGTVPLRPHITVTGSPGRGAGTLTLEGRNFTAGSNVANAAAILWAGTAIAAGNIITTLPLTNTDRDLDTGLDDFRLQIRVPSGQTSGIKKVQVTDVGTATASVNVEVTARSASLSPSSGPVGTRVTITGAGFPSSVAAAAGNTVTLAQAGVSAAVTGIALGTDTAGGFQNIVVSVPATVGARTLTAGTLTMTASVASLSGDAGANTATGVFTITTSRPVFTLSPTSGPRGTSVVASGSRFTASGSVVAGALTIGGTAWNTAAIGVGADGNLVSTTLTVPSTVAYGSNAVYGTSTGTSTKTGISAFTATQPTIAISPSSGTVGVSVTVTGSGWVPSSLVTLTRGGTAAVTVTTTASGDFTGQLPIPSTLNTGGTVRVAIAANDGTTRGNVADASTYTISSAAITLSASSVAVGGSVTISGTGFLPNTGLSALAVGGVSVLPTAPVISDSVGAWSTSFSAPGLVGVRNLTMTHGLVNRTANLTITAATSGTTGAVAATTALSSLTTAGVLELASAVVGGGSTFSAFVPGLAGNPLTEIAPNSVLILTVTADTTVVVSGVSFSLTADTPAFIPVGATVSITVS